ncbi:dihydropteridine reductase [Marinilactibacillus piezotolerans]|uniref:dihydropteridine reductase n=1 Tax=Marinilactibacillus piezotolerans TaxID=258723 RepID=UPI0009AFDF0B|nr:dihydropteridine reductase [Marinilactibacillus piezotolerans]
MRIYWTEVNQIIEETPNTKTYLFSCLEDFIWEEGAHTHLALEGFNAGEKPNRSLVRHMSISTLPHEEKIGITTRIKENASEFKTILNKLKVGDNVALFKTGSRIQLKRQDKPIILLSCGVGIATFRPLILQYLQNPAQIKSLHSLNVDSSGQFLFRNSFLNESSLPLTTQYVDNRLEYYTELNQLIQNNDALFYVVGSDEFLSETISAMKGAGISPNQIILDKHEKKVSEFLVV